MPAKTPPAVSRRTLLAAGTSIAALAATRESGAAPRRLSPEESRFRMTNTSVMTIPKDPRLDLDDPETNYRAMLKLRADTAAKDCLFVGSADCRTGTTRGGWRT